MSKYDDLGIFELRAIGREIGVKSPTTYKRDELIKNIENIEKGIIEPYRKTKRQGRPAKNINIKVVGVINDEAKLNLDSAKKLIREYKLFYLALKNINQQTNKLIDDFLEDLKNF